MFSVEKLQRVVRDSGLNKSELAALYGVSRQTLYTWLDDQPPRPGSLQARLAEAITATILAAIDKRALPLVPTDVRQRRERIAKMRDTLQNLKPAPAQQ
jgi:DNA-binding XRE family transcriptional regulator